jgi:hypothetical protein
MKRILLQKRLVAEDVSLARDAGVGLDNGTLFVGKNRQKSMDRAIQKVASGSGFQTDPLPVLSQV